MKTADRLSSANRRLQWIAALSAKTLPDGVPVTESDVRELLNRIVLDVRAATIIAIVIVIVIVIECTPAALPRTITGDSRGCVLNGRAKAEVMTTKIMPAESGEAA
jgi:hypothetical protein